MLSKSAITSNGKFVVIGGNKENEPTCEELDLPTMKWRTINVTNIRTITNWKCMGYSAYTTKVEFAPEQAKKSYVPNPHRNFNDVSMIIGTDDEPFLLEIDKGNQKVEVRPCPLKLKLKNYQGVRQFFLNFRFVK